MPKPATYPTLYNEALGQVTKALFEVGGQYRRNM